MTTKRRSVPTTIVRAHIAPFVDAGYGTAAIAAAAAVHVCTVQSVLAGSTTVVRSGAAAALMGITWRDMVVHAGASSKVPAVGALRRIQALVWAGWPARAIARHAGLSHATIDGILYERQPRIHVDVHDRIATAFRDLWDKTPDPVVGRRWAEAARRRARRYGYKPALAWDDIDNPVDVPDVDGQGGDDAAPAPRSTLIEDLEHLLDTAGPWTWASITARLGVTKSAIEHACGPRRHNRPDLLGRLRGVEHRDEAAA